MITAREKASFWAAMVLFLRSAISCCTGLPRGCVARCGAGAKGQETAFKFGACRADDGTVFTIAGRQGQVMAQGEGGAQSVVKVTVPSPSTMPAT